MGELAVVGQQEQPLGLGVEAADMHQAQRVGQLGVLGQVVASILGHGGAALRVLHGGDDPCRLVEHEGDELGVGEDSAAVNADLLGQRVHPHACLGDGNAVDADAAVGDELLAGAARGNPCVGQDLLQPLSGGDVRVVLAALGGTLTHLEQTSLLVLVDGLGIEGGQVAGVGLLVQLLEVILVVELLGPEVAVGHGLGSGVAVPRGHGVLLPAISSACSTISPSASTRGR